MNDAKSNESLEPTGVPGEERQEEQDPMSEDDTASGGAPEPRTEGSDL